MHDLPIRRVAIIGAGISGVVSAAHLLRAGLDVTVFERNKEPGGIWLHSVTSAIEVQYPCVRPPDAERHSRDERNGKERQYLLHAPPGPCYDSLTSNIASPLVETTLNAWPKDTPKFVNHRVIKKYIQDTSKIVELEKVTLYGAFVTKIWKESSVWVVSWTRLQEDEGTGGLTEIHNTSTYDAIVVASGHYHTPVIPDIPGLAEAKSKWPLRITHSKYYRNSVGFEDKNVLLIGGGVSSTDIAKDISPKVKAIFQSTRNGDFDMPASVLPGNASRVSEVTAIDIMAAETTSLEHPPFVVHLKCGRILHDIDRIVICTGYQITLPFLPQYNDNTATVAAADDKVLITDGRQVHNLHRDIFYIPDPTLVFVGLPIFNTTFSLFEFQAVAVAAFFAGIIQLPPMSILREEYQNRVKSKGYGRRFHSLKEEEEPYVMLLVQWVNDGRAEHGLPLVEGHTPSWKAEKELLYQEILKLRARKAAEKLAEISKLPVECN